MGKIVFLSQWESYITIRTNYVKLGKEFSTKDKSNVDKLSYLIFLIIHFSTYHIGPHIGHTFLMKNHLESLQCGLYVGTRVHVAFAQNRTNSS